MDRVTAQKQGTEVGIVAYLGGFRRDAQNGACSRIHSTSNDLNEEFIIEHVGNRLEGDRTNMFAGAGRWRLDHGGETIMAYYQCHMDSLC